MNDQEYLIKASDIKPEAFDEADASEQLNHLNYLIDNHGIKALMDSDDFYVFVSLRDQFMQEFLLNHLIDTEEKIKNLTFDDNQKKKLTDIQLNYAFLKSFLENTIEKIEIETNIHNASEKARFILRHYCETIKTKDSKKWPDRHNTPVYGSKLEWIELINALLIFIDGDVKTFNTIYNAFIDKITEQKKVRKESIEKKYKEHPYFKSVKEENHKTKYVFVKPQPDAPFKEYHILTIYVFEHSKIEYNYDVQIDGDIVPELNLKNGFGIPEWIAPLIRI